MIYLITVNYYSAEYVKKLARSLQSASAPYRLIVVNNSPDDLPIQSLQQESIVLLESGENLGFGLACNLGLNWVYDRDPQATVWLINADAEPLPQAPETAQFFFKDHPEISILGTIVYDRSGKVWFGGGKFIPYLGAVLSDNLFEKDSSQELLPSPWVTGCSLLVNLKRFPRCPQFSSDYFLYYEDFDFCQRYGREGHQIVVTTQIGVIHEVSAITDRNVAFKLQHSTYSYLVILQKYAPRVTLAVRLLGILIRALLRFPLQPTTATGILRGIRMYLQWVTRH